MCLELNEVSKRNVGGVFGIKRSAAANKTELKIRRFYPMEHVQEQKQVRKFPRNGSNGLVNVRNPEPIETWRNFVSTFRLRKKGKQMCRRYIVPLPIDFWLRADSAVSHRRSQIVEKTGAKFLSTMRQKRDERERERKFWRILKKN